MVLSCLSSIIWHRLVFFVPSPPLRPAPYHTVWPRPISSNKGKKKASSRLALCRPHLPTATSQAVSARILSVGRPLPCPALSFSWVTQTSWRCRCSVRSYCVPSCCVGPACHGGAEGAEGLAPPCLSALPEVPGNKLPGAELKRLPHAGSQGGQRATGSKPTPSRTCSRISWI